MRDATRRALNALNRRFYDARGDAFDASRDHPWPGWQRALREMQAAVPDADPRRVLDVGCGNGRFAAHVAHADARPTQYLGIDSSRPLLDRARQSLQDTPPHFTAELRELDFLEPTCAEPRSPEPDTLEPTRPEPDSSEPARLEPDVTGPHAIPEGTWDWIVVFGVLHHVPSEVLRRELVEVLAARLAPGGVLVLTAWQFADRERFARSIFPTDAVSAQAEENGFDASDLEPGDHLLGFGGNAAVPRYCHHLDHDEFDRLTAGLGLTLTAEFEADGKSADLNLYRVYVKRVH